MAQVQSPQKAALIALALVTAAPASAQQVIGDCYARAYDMGHMGKHPDQKVTEVVMQRLDDEPGVPAKLYGLSFRYVGETGAFGAVIGCFRDTMPAICGALDEYGGVKVEARDNGAILLKLGPEGLITWSDGAQYIISGSAGDDREFLLRPCN